jgi:methylated-DNA-[protein]-cysteine S-methyltransferase
MRARELQQVPFEGSSGRSQRQPAYSLFETALGLCAIVWKTCEGEGQDPILVSGFQLPEATPELAELRLRSRWPAQRALRVPPPIQNIIERVRLHFEGKVQDFSDINLELEGVRKFSQQVYAAARTIPAGRTMTYGQLARAAGSAGAARAVGSALSRNPIPLIIPCHRVLAAGNKPGGFSAHGGLRTKAQLLKIEGAPVPDFGDCDRES